jgi:GNAT superfamily N-acetyltransferase
MGASRFRPYVDRAWADAFGISVDELHEPGVRVVTGAPMLAGHPGAYVLHLGEAVIIGVGALRALGPSWHSYLHRDDFRPGTAAGRRVVEADHDAIRRFQEIVGEDDFHEGGFGWEPFPEVAWVLEDGEGVAALGNMTDFGGAPADVGLVTRPDARGRGLATQLATAMLVECFEDHEVARYRALTTNAASIAVARRLGFEGYGENVAVRPV